MFVRQDKLALIVNFFLIISFYRLPLLTKSGWLHAGALGTVLWGCLGWQGWLAVVLYLTFGSLVTKLGFAYKDSILNICKDHDIHSWEIGKIVRKNNSKINKFLPEIII